MKINPQYKFVATSRTGFVQQVVCSYVKNGYRFHVAGRIPEEKDPSEVDEKLLSLYGIRKNNGQRYRAKIRGEANIQYIRSGHDWLMLETTGSHLWKEREGANIKDCSRGDPIKFSRLLDLFEERSLPSASLQAR